MKIHTWFAGRRFTYCLCAGGVLLFLGFDHDAAV